MSANYNVILLDMNFSAGVNTGNEGLYWLKEIVNLRPEISVVMITAYGEIKLAVEAMKRGASDFIQKGQDAKYILQVIKNALQKNLSSSRNKILTPSDPASAKLIYGHSGDMRRIKELIEKISSTDASVMILGENGTGKELIAREIHRLSNRSKKPMVTVDLATIPENLIESELFGHVKGAFTDAKEDRKGRFEQASGGTLFLDEVGNMPLAAQVKLLTVLQTRNFNRLGSNSTIPTDIRLISATNMPVHKMVEEGKFRKDLLYRINTIQLEVPPLRERREDIEALSEYILSIYTKRYNKPNLSLSDDAKKKLSRYDWPGNIRELYHAIEKAVILTEGDIIDSSEFSFPESDDHFHEADGFDLEAHEKKLIQKAIKKFQGNLTETAKNLGITRSTLYKKIEKYGI